MTDLTRERIEEIKKWKSLFDRGEVVNFLSVGETHDLARQLLAAMTERDEAQAAQAGVVERCAAEMDLAAHIMSHHGSFQEQRAYENAAKSIRSLADPTGVKLLAELRQREANLALHAANLADQLAEARASEHGLLGRVETCRQDESELRALLALPSETQAGGWMPPDIDAIENGGKRWHGEDHRVVSVRWEPYKPDGQRQMKAKGRWQEQVGTGDYWRWQNCERPAFAPSLPPAPEGEG